MKQKFSAHWIGSKQTRKQRKYQYNAPLHLKHSFLNAHLSKELRKTYAKRALPLRKGDEVLVMRGAFKKKKAKVASVNLKNSLVILEGMQKSKKDGTKVNISFEPSNLMIVSLDMNDKKRIFAAQRKTATPKKEKKIEKKTEKLQKTSEKK